MLGAVVVAVGVGAVVVAGAGGDEPDPEEALERAATALEEADSFRLRMTTEDRSVVGDAGGAGSDMTFRTVTEVDVAGDDFRSRTDSGDWVDELVAVDGQFYTRADDEDWGVWPDEPVPAGEPVDPVDELRVMIEDSRELGDDDAMVEEMVVSLAGGLYLGTDIGLQAGFVGGDIDLPAGFVELFGSFADAEVVDDSGDGLTLRATRRLDENIGFPVPPGEFEIRLDGEDRPVALRLVVEGDTARHQTEIGFADWDADIVIAAPEGEIDETPWVDEELLAEVLATVSPLAPTAVPDGLVLTGVTPLSADEAEEIGSGSCAQLELWYEPPPDSPAYEEWLDDPDYLSIYLLPAGCALEAESTPFEPGTFGDVPSRESDAGFVEVLVGETVVQFDTTYTEDLPAMVASLQPFDVDAVLATMAEGPLMGTIVDT